MAINDLQQRLAPAMQQHAERLDELDAQISDGTGDITAILSERGRIEKLVNPWRTVEKLTTSIQEAQQLLDEEDDEELKELAQLEIQESSATRSRLLEEIAGQLVTQEDAAIDSLYIEVRAGSGGAEAALFSGELIEAYQTFARKMNLRSELLDFTAGEAGGLRQAILTIKGEGAYSAFGYEGGVHCVKRVPATESQGRIHTSTCTVAVLPEPKEFEFNLDADEVDEELYCASSGPGGQNVNKVATAVRLIHLPSGLEVRMCEGRSQAQNREKAWQLLRARLAQQAREEELAKTNANRRAMIGSGGRSERVRTYRFKDNIVVDERVQGQHSLNRIMNGDLSALIEALQAEDQIQRLSQL